MADGSFKKTYAPKQENIRKLDEFLKKLENGRIEFHAQKGGHVRRGKL